MNKKKNVFIIIGIILVILVVCAIYMTVQYVTEKKEDEVALTLKQNLTTDFNTEHKVSEYIENLNGTIINDFNVDTTSLGTSNVTFDYMSQRNKKKTKTFEITVIDTTKPIIYMNDTMTVKVGYDKNLINTIFSVDDCDDKPTREIIGKYDFNVPGSYDLTYKITDHSGNYTEQKFTLNVVESYNSSGTTSTTPEKIQFLDAYSKYKTSKTKLGVDVSQWQGDINWTAVRNAGAEFAIIRVGYQKGTGKENMIDPYFEKNIKGATEAGLQVGLYFYTYANTVEEAKEQAEFVINNCKGYKISLPIAFDWEDWSCYVEDYTLSLYSINNLAKVFNETIENAGYTATLYSSKNYLERVWYAKKYENVWLAHYTSNTTYAGKYNMWQFCSNGRIDGISGDVDIDVLY